MAAIAPLTGIKLIDLTKLAPGPHCTMILGDLGADIIKVEEPGAPTGRRAEQGGATGKVKRVVGFGAVATNALARNKKSIGINLKSDAGKEIYLKLVQSADVVVEEFRPGVAKRLGIDYETLSATNPKLVYCAVTGFGQTGPFKNYVGHDLNYIATSGALSMIGRKDQPPSIPLNLLADYAGGGMHAAIGVLAALLARHQTGRGQYVDIAMLDGTMLLIAQALSTYFTNQKIPKRGYTSMDGARAVLQPVRNQGRQDHHDWFGRAVVLRQPVPRARLRGIHHGPEQSREVDRDARALRRDLQDPHARRMVRLPQPSPTSASARCSPSTNSNTTRKFARAT